MTPVTTEQMLIFRTYREQIFFKIIKLRFDRQNHTPIVTVLTVTLDAFNPHSPRFACSKCISFFWLMKKGLS